MPTPSEPTASDEWAQATSAPDATLLPAVVGERSLVSLRDSNELLALRDVVLGIVDATVTTMRGLVGIPAWDRSNLVDATLETTWRCWTSAERGLSAARDLTAPAVRFAFAPPFLPDALRPATIAQGAARSWDQRRDDVQSETVKVRDAVVQTSVNTAMSSIDLTELVKANVDLREIVEAVIAELDLTEVVMQNVDLERLTNAVLDTINLDEVARERMDLLDLANYVIDGIDLPEIIRESTGSVASETVKSVRMQSIDADVAVQKIVDRILLRRRQRHATAASQDEHDGQDEST